MSPARDPSNEAKEPHPSDVLVDAVSQPQEFSRVLANWLEREETWRDARLRFASSFDEQNRYTIDRLVGSANMFDILPAAAVPADVLLSDELGAARDAARKAFLAWSQSPERDSVLSALGRAGKSTLKHKIRHRAQKIVEAVGERFPELVKVTDEAVNCRNYYVHGSERRFDYSGNFHAVTFFIDTLEFVFAGFDLIEAGWDVKAWSNVGTTMSHPFARFIDIERALKNDYSKEPHKRNLQLEAKAHITVQKWIDSGGLRNGRAVSDDGICEIHRRFCAELPEQLLWVEDPDTKERIKIVPGELRRRDAKVGNHVPISPGAVPRFLNRFELVYGHLGKTDAILGAAPGHHRLLWIHPFLDGNGRVARLMSHAVLLETLDTGAVWSVARGLARKVAEYKRHLAACDSPRRNDLDGRSALSEEALAAFTTFFLEVCVDQVEFMEGLMQPDALRARILLWAEEQIKLSKLPPSSGRVLEAVLYRGNLPRSGVASVAGASTRTATRIVSALTEAGILTSDTPYAPVRLVFPAALAERWMPGLFPEKRE